MTVFQGTTQNGKTLVVRYPTMDDVERLQRYYNALSSERTFIRAQGEQVSLEKEREFLEGALKRVEEGQAVRLVAFVDDQLAGMANIEMSDRTEKHIGGLGIGLDASFRGIGIGEQLMTILLEEAFKALPGLEIVKLEVFSTNKRAITLYKKLGFHEYGVLPNGVKLGDGYVDCMLMYKQLREES